MISKLFVRILTKLSTKLENMAEAWLTGRRTIDDLERRLGEAHAYLRAHAETSVKLYRYESGLEARMHKALLERTRLIKEEICLPHLFDMCITDEEIRAMVRNRLKSAITEQVMDIVLKEVIDT